MSTDEVIFVKGKIARYRRSNWSDEETEELIAIWSQPEILIGLKQGQGLCKRQKTYVRISEELSKRGKIRETDECQRKIKNLRITYKKAKAGGTLDTFRFQTQMEKVLRLERALALTNRSKQESASRNQDDSDEEDEEEVPFDCGDNDSDSNEEGFKHISAGKQNITMSTENQNGAISHPVEIEFELMDLVKGEMPIEIEGGSIVVPQEFVNDVGILESCSSHIQAMPYQVNSTCAGGSSAATKRGMNPQEILSKRRKLQSLSEKMADSVSRVLTKSTNLLIEEMRKSEERFMKWEEERREKERKQEEQMLKKLMDAIKTQRTDQTGMSHETSQVLEDPCAATFDRLASNLMTTVTEQTREIEDSFLEWETRMQRQETRHTDNLFKMILSAVNNSSLQ